MTTAIPMTAHWGRPIGAGFVGGVPVGGIYWRNVACTTLETSDCLSVSSRDLMAKAYDVVVSFSPIGTRIVNCSMLPNSCGAVRLPTMRSDCVTGMPPIKSSCRSGILSARRISYT